MKKHRTKLNKIAYKLLKQIQNYSDTYTRVVFMGLSLYPNSGHMFNWDIVYLYKTFLESSKKTYIEARIHDPHIRGSEGIAAGVWMGRQNDEEKWTNNYDVLILSCPHMFYINNLSKIAHLFKTSKPCLFLDLYGVITKLSTIGDNIDIVDFSTEYEPGDILGGLIPINRPRLTSPD
jgi:UDP-N-acetyl-D-mannosaminuronate dehydrogenase